MNMVDAHTYGCVSMYVGARSCLEGVRMCLCVCVCEQVAGIFEDDSRGLTHARPNKATL